MIRLEKIHKTYVHAGKTAVALNDINIQIDQGKTLGIIGLSGAGKSTLLRMINLLEQPDSGNVIINNQNLCQLSNTELKQARKKIGMIFQHFNLLSRCTVAENIALPLTLEKLDKPAIAEKVSDLLKLVGLEDKANHYPNQLSGGQKQRVAIARALATDPEILLCDEATSALDPQTTETILDLIQTIKQQLKLTVVLITHELEVVKKIADNVIVMENAKVIEQNDIVSLFTEPQHTLTKSFVESNLKSTVHASIASRLQPDPNGFDHVIVRLTFRGNAARDAIVHELSRQFKVSTNILQANLEIIKNHSIGMMLIGLDYEPKRLAKIEKFLTEKSLTFEVLGYVNRNDLADH